MTGAGGPYDGRGASVPPDACEAATFVAETDLDTGIDAGLDAALNDLSKSQTFTTYGALARALNIPGPGSIAKLTAALERTMAQDATNNRPLRAARVVARVPGTLPAPGFFAHATALNLYHGADTGPDAEAFHRAQLVP